MSSICIMCISTLVKYKLPMLVAINNTKDLHNLALRLTKIILFV